MNTKIPRREILDKGLKTLGAVAGLWLAGPALLKVAFAAADTTDEILVTVFLRGGADGLNLVLPIAGEDREIYEAARPQIKIAATGDKGALKLDERFGLHPSASALYQLYLEKKLAIIHSCGLPSDTRSHFDAQAYMELGTPDRKSTQSGWVTRYLENRHIGNTPLLTAVSVGNLVPTALLGYPEAAIVNNLKGFQIGGNKKFIDAEIEAIKKMYGSAGSPWLGRYGLETLEAIHLLKDAPDSYSAAPGASYPKEDLGNRLKTLAQLIKMKVGVRVATVDMGGWDTHKYQGSGTDGQFAKQVGQLSDALTAFYRDMQGFSSKVTIVVMTEFGRRLKENANHGTDHGHGGVMVVLGDHLKGGKVHGRWLGLKTEHLYERADVAVANDYRVVLNELLTKRMHVKKTEKIFPKFDGQRGLGIFG
jgi:uncharacterized protein (DUF1501 family)